MEAIYLTQRFEMGEASSEHAKDLAEMVVERGGDAAIVSFDDGSYYEVDERVEVRRVDLPFDGDNLYSWSMMMNNELKRQARELFDDPELIHAVDWTAIPGGVALAKHFGAKLAITFQSTENERGFEGEHAEIISELEWDGAFEADILFATNQDTKNSLLFDLDVPGEKLEVVDPFESGWREDVYKKYSEIIEQEMEVRYS
ncbi:MAG: glycosyltransferase family 4 protein [Candidatus Nanohaloarchaea archaeon]